MPNYPEPYTLDDVEEKFWNDELFDTYLPSPGWLTDFILYYRGREAPTKFCLWSGISVISMILKRDAWLWNKDHYPNLYIALVAPPRINAKGYIINQAEKVWKASFKHMPSSMLRAKKYTRAVHSSMTIQSVSEYFAPHTESFKDEQGKYQTIEKGTEVAFIIGELSTFLGKEKYNEGKIMKLTDFYDCKDDDDDVTISRGDKKMKDIYVTILGGTTRGNISRTIPEEAFSTGFMSRLILVDQYERTRNFPEPRSVYGGPQWEELAQRLAFIAAKADGRYELTPEAKEHYHAWYTRWFEEELPLKEGLRSEMYNRYDIHLLKLAVIIRAQRYEPGTDITLEDFQDAEKILRGTYEHSPSAIATVGDGDFSRNYVVVRNKLERERKIQRTDLVRHASAYKINVGDVNKALYQLCAEENLKILSEEGHERTTPSRNGKEMYIWIY